MRLKDPGAQRLIDLPLLQADRLDDPAFAQALARGGFDPFPDGTQGAGSEDRCSVQARNSGVTETALSGGALTGFSSSLPDHLQDALQAGLHNDDDGLKTFLGLFDKRLMQLEIRARRAAVLVATQDHTGREAANILDRLMRMVKRPGGDTRYVQLLMPLLSRARSLEGLRDIASWWMQRPVSVTASFDTMHPIDPDCRTRISAHSPGTAGLGQGTLLGRMGQTPMGRISVSVACKDRAALDQLTADPETVSGLKSVIAQYMRDPVPVTIYADVQRRHLTAPQLSAQPDGGCRLGAYNLLQPHLRPNAHSAIKLAAIQS